MNDEEKQQNAIEALRDARRALMKLRRLVAEYGDVTLTQTNVRDFVRLGRDQFNALSLALPFLASEETFPKASMEDIELQETARDNYKRFLENA